MRLRKTHIEVFLNEFLESLLFSCQKRVYGANWRLSTFFQIDIEIIRMMRSKDFSFSFAENVSEFVILRRDVGNVRSFCKFCGISLNVIMCIKTNIFLFLLSIFLDFIFLFFWISFSFYIFIDDKEAHDCGHRTCHMM